jgi:glycerophosphoryl diester phosphodiesterase
MFAVIAHRGNSALAPENTLKAFDLALELGPAFELDVQLSIDNVCIVLHDEKLGRTNDGSGLVAETTWHDLSKLDAGSWFGSEHADCRIPTLQQVLERYHGRAHIHLVRPTTCACMPELRASMSKELKAHHLNPVIWPCCFTPVA